ncbi:MAG: PAS domain S-box [Solidesulfovibrio magneticus str. Maddingley MBC34]|uniref:PAS domain S-box n=1 Tax=Solidesulfovibrio magneticus str. Maddingley MBC34 TaxID=1206767 RepID=K6GHC6_9BACT|nr:MAG: PAS domain S-box [Solidesulfovibrio magneticus str. Maddingley MBC34]
MTHHLGSFAIDAVETFNASRKKILRLAQALGFDAIDAGRLASIFSEITRPHSGGGSVRVALSLVVESQGTVLALRFPHPLSGPSQALLSRFFDALEPMPSEGGLAGFEARKRLPPTGLALTEPFLDELRELLSTPSREELLLALKHKNAALEREVAERRLAEEALRRSESRIQAVLEGTPDALLMVDADGTMTYANSQAEKTFGYGRQELLGQPIAMLVPEAQRPGHDARVRHFFAEDRTREMGMAANLYARTKDGRRIAIDLKLSPLHTETGRQVIASIRDITEQKQALESIRQLSLVVEQSPASVVITDRAGRIEYVNPAFTLATGYAREEVLGRNPRILKSGQTPSEVHEALWSTITAGNIWRGLLINRRKGGENFWEQTAIAPISNLDGVVSHFVAIKEDITDRIRYEEEIKRQRTLLDTLINALPLVIYAKDANGAYQVVNDSLAALVGLPREAVVGRTAYDVFPKATADAIHQADALALKSEQPTYAEDWRTYPDGRRAIFHMTRVPLRNEIGQAIGLVGAFLDVTESKEAEMAIRCAQAEMTQIFNSAAGGMRVIDRDGTVVKVNDAFVAMTGYSRETVVGKRCHEYFGSQDCHSRACPLARILDGKERLELTVPKKRKDGTTIYCDVGVTRHLSPDGELLGIIEDFRDVTARVEAQRRIHESEVKYRELVERAKSIILKLDLDGNITFFNEYAQAFFGFGAQEILGRPIVGTIVPESESGGRDLRQMIRAIICDPVAYERNENENVCKDGSRVWISWTNQISLDEATGEPCGLLCIGLDATERKKAQDALGDAMEVISGSIRYASRIQRAILPQPEDFEALFARHFVVWSPRDVVGGDIYWHAKWGEGHVFVLGDCTGHGVPGAFMTLIAAGALSRAIGEVAPGRAGQLMQRAHQIIQTSLNQHLDGGESDDGMELGMCYVAPDRQSMLFVGARFPLFLEADGDIIEIKSDKKGIGYRGIAYDQEYHEHLVPLRPGLRLYLVSDGLFDQVGGERRRGFGKNRFKDCLRAIAGEPFDQHGARLFAALQAFQGDEIRRDDVSIMGLECC